MNTTQEIQLNKSQLDGLVKFKQWFASSERIAHIRGAGGSGKTTAVRYWLKAIGLKSSEVLAAAPTHTAALKLSQQLGEGIKCGSLHGILGLRPIKVGWDNEATKQYREIKQGLTDENASILALKAKAHSSDALLFGSGDLRAEWRRIKLLIVDEVSMNGQELFDQVLDLIEETDLKVIGLGDPEQLFPVTTDKKPRMSPFFKTKLIAELSGNMRVCISQDGNLAKVIEDLRNLRDPRDQISLLEKLPLAHYPEKIQDGEARVLSIIGKSMLPPHLVTRAQDGLDYRYLAYTNASVDHYSQEAQSNIGGFYREGDLMVARGSVEYSLLNTSARRRTITILNPGNSFKLGKKIESRKLIGDATGFSDITFERYEIEFIDHGHSFYRLMRDNFLDSLEDVKMRIARGWDFEIGVPEFSSLKRLVENFTSINQFFPLSPNPKLYRTISIPSWESQESYQKLFSLFDKAQKAIFRHDKSQSKTDLANNESVAQLLKFIGECLGVDLSKPKLRSAWWQDDQALLKGDCGETFIRHFLNGRHQYDSKTKRPPTYGILYGLSKYVAMPVGYPQASTIHKSQGQSINTVILDLADIKNLLKYKSDEEEIRRLIYTAASRASRHLLIIT